MQSNLTHMISVVDSVAIGFEKGNGSSLKEGFTKLINMNSHMIL